jgi:hypothetical protein
MAPSGSAPEAVEPRVSDSTTSLPVATDAFASTVRSVEDARAPA